MAIPDSADLITLLVEKTKHSGISWLQRISRRTEEEAADYLSQLLTRYRKFYADLRKEEIYDNLDELVYQLSLDGSHILGIALYKEVKATSLEAAHHKQKELMTLRGNTKPAPGNFLTQLRNRAAGTNAETEMNRVTNQMNSSLPPLKKYILGHILLAAGIGAFSYLSVNARQLGQFGKATQYTLFATFCVMGLVMLILFRIYNSYVRRRIERGEVIKKG